VGMGVVVFGGGVSAWTTDMDPFPHRHSSVLPLTSLMQASLQTPLHATHPLGHHVASALTPPPSPSSPPSHTPIRVPGHVAVHHLPSTFVFTPIPPDKTHTHTHHPLTNIPPTPPLQVVAGWPAFGGPPVRGPAATQQQQHSRTGRRSKDSNSIPQRQRATAAAAATGRQHRQAQQAAEGCWCHPRPPPAAAAAAAA